jgi:hypothetical protein
MPILQEDGSNDMFQEDWTPPHFLNLQVSREVDWQERT